MKNWKELYDSKKMTSDEAILHFVKSGDKVVFQHDVGEPEELVRALVRNAENSNTLRFLICSPWALEITAKKNIKKISIQISGLYQGRPEKRLITGEITQRPSSTRSLS